MKLATATAERVCKSRFASFWKHHQKIRQSWLAFHTYLDTVHDALDNRADLIWSASKPNKGSGKGRRDASIVLSLDFCIVVNTLHDLFSLLSDGCQFTFLGPPKTFLQFCVHRTYGLVCSVDREAIWSSSCDVDLIPEMGYQGNRDFAVTCEAVEERVALGVYTVESKRHLVICNGGRRL